MLKFNKMKDSKNKKFANFDYERKLWQRGYSFVAGLDEAGRGPIAGPVTAAAVMVRQFPISNFLRPRQVKRGGQFPKKIKIQNQELLIRDSKKLTAKQREEWYKILTSHPQIKWGVGIVSEKIIDRINILEATKLAMKRALKNLGVAADYLLLDGNFLLEDLNISQKAVKRGDEMIWSCAAASVIAKVARDRLMVKYHKKYPQYGFDKHKGYGTVFHFRRINDYGPCKIHRSTFSPIRTLEGSFTGKA